MNFDQKYNGYLILPRRLPPSERTLAVMRFENLPADQPLTVGTATEDDRPRFQAPAVEAQGQVEQADAVCAVHCQGGRGVSRHSQYLRGVEEGRGINPCCAVSIRSAVSMRLPVVPEQPRPVLAHVRWSMCCDWNGRPVPQSSVTRLLRELRAQMTDDLFLHGQTVR